MTMPDLFGEKHISIKGDAYLNKIAQHIFELYERDKTIVDGENMGAINRRVHYEMMCDSGLLPIIKSGDISQFKEWYITKQCVTEEETARALRGLIAEGHILIKKSVILASEQFKSRISSSLRR